MSYLHLIPSVELRWNSEVNLGIKHSVSRAQGDAVEEK